MVVCQAAGGYEGDLLAALLAAGVPAHRADAVKVKAFIRSVGTLGSTDDIDARALARYGQERHAQLAPWQARDRQRQRLQALVLTRRDMVKDRLACANRGAAPGAELAQAHIEAIVASFDAQIKAIDGEISVLIAQCEPIARARNILLAIQGVGAKTAAALIALMPELGTLARRRAAAVSLSLAWLRATRASAEKSRARRMALARPMPWLAPVTMATDLDIRGLRCLRGARLFAGDGARGAHAVRQRGDGRLVYHRPDVPDPAAPEFIEHVFVKRAPRRRRRGRTIRRADSIRRGPLAGQAALPI